MRRQDNIKSRMTCPIPGGFLVAIEGIDGAGKTTVANLLADFCKENKLSYIVSKEPTKGQFGKQIRDSALRGRMSIDEEVELLRRDRQEHVENIIRPALDAEKIVLLDRYYFSTAAYQGAHGADADFILASNEMFAPQPDLLAVLDVSPEMGIKRIRHRGDTPNKFETMESLTKAREIFKHIERPYKYEIDAENSIEYVSFFVGKAFQARAVSKISKNHFSPEGMNRTLEFFGGERIHAHA
jgi:dTMP kinase